MPNQILQVDENMLETKLDRLVSEKVEQLLNAMLDAEADEITGACRRSYTLECKTNAARRALEGEPLARVARDAGCTPTSVYQWMRRYRSEGILGLMDRRNAPMPALATSGLCKTVSRLFTNSVTKTSTAVSFPASAPVKPCPWT